MSSENREILVPIKDIVVSSINNGGVMIGENEVNLLRKYFIAGLNLGFFEVDNLKSLMDIFSTRIKKVEVITSFGMIDDYMIQGENLVITDISNDEMSDEYIITFFKAITEILLGFAKEKSRGFIDGLCEIVAEKIFFMDSKQQRIVFPKAEILVVHGEKLELRTGYLKNGLIICLLKQFLILYDYNENCIIRDMFLNGGLGFLKKVKNNNEQLLLLEILDVVYSSTNGESVNPKKQIELIEKYQIIINNLFNEKDMRYFAFLALVTSDELRKKCLSKCEDE